MVDFKVGAKTKKGKKLTIDGISIVNGAQTTGSIGSLGHAPADDMLVPVRFVKVQKDKISNNIVRYNNSQNKLQAADFRSNDSIQDRLRSEFSKIPHAEYEGGRRGGVSDTIKRSKFSLPSYTVGQSLAAFHGDPVIAYDKKSEIWTNENLYRRFFTDRTSAKHIVFCYSLLQEINTRKIDLSQRFRKAPGSLTQSEKDNLNFLSRKGAPYLLMHVISLSMEAILSKPIPNKSDLYFSENIAPDKARKYWVPIVDMMLSLSNQLDGAFSRGRISNEAIAKAVPTFVGVISSLKAIHKQTFNDFAKVVKLGG